MTKLLKTLSIIVLAAMMLSVVSACGSAATTPAATTAATTKAATTASGTTAATTKAASTDPILIGVSTAITGSSPLDGERTKQGVELAVEEINAKGGVLGRPLKLLIEDDQNLANISVNVANKLMSQNIVAQLGPQKSGNATAVQPIALQNKVPFLTGGTSPTLVTFNNPYLFRLRASDGIVAKVAAKFAVEELKAKKVGILFNNDDYGKGAQKVAEEYLKSVNIPFVSEGHNTGDKDSTGQIMKMKNEKVEALIIWTHAPEFAVIARQLKELSLNVPFVGSPTVNNQDFLKLVDADMVEGQYCVTDFSADDPAKNIADYVARVKTKYNLVPELFMTTYYDAVYIVADAIKRAGSADREAVRKALMETKNLQGAMGMKNCNDKGELVHEATIVVMKNKTAVMKQKVTG